MTYSDGKKLADELNPGVREVLDERYGHLLP